MTQVVVSLSTIPPRFPFIGQTLQSLLAQSVRPDRIEVWIPRSYRRFPEHAFCVPDVPDGVTIEVIDEDLGPATKVLPCVRKYRGTDTRIVYVDDDRIYWRCLLESLLEAAKSRPHECIAAKGADVKFFFKEATGRRSRFPRANAGMGGIRNLLGNLPYWIVREIAFTRQKGSPWMVSRHESGYADIAQGFMGVLVRPEFFDDEAFDIPPILWAVDDFWLSGCLARKDIPIWVERVVSRRKRDKRKTEATGGVVAPLLSAVIEGHNRAAANRACIRYFREKHGIWL